MAKLMLVGALVLASCGTPNGTEENRTNDIPLCESSWRGPLDRGVAPYNIEVCLRADDCAAGEIQDGYILVYDEDRLPPAANDDPIILASHTGMRPTDRLSIAWIAQWIEEEADGTNFMISLSYDPETAEVLTDDDRASVRIRNNSGNVVVDVSEAYGPGSTDDFEQAFCRTVALGMP